MKYIETRGQVPFNWHIQLNQAEHLSKVYKATQPDEQAILEYEDFTEQLTNLSKSWVTCACGNQCAVFPRLSNGEPKDDKLATWGVLFYEAVKDRDWFEARKWLNQIEGRSGELLRNVYTAPQPLAANPMILL